MIAAGVNTIVGFTVAHWVVITSSKVTGYLVSAASFALCAASALLALSARRTLGEADDTLPEHGRQMFMAKLGLMLAGLAAVVVLAGTLALLTLRPND